MVLAFFRKDPSSGLDHVVSKAVAMLGDARHSFDLATLALLTPADSETVAQDIRETDDRINRTEQELRSQLVVHISVQGSTEIGSVLGLTLLLKKIERVGDQAKNILDLATCGPKSKGSPYFDQLLDLKQRISKMLQDTRELYEAQDSDRAPAFIEVAEVLKDECDDAVEKILRAHDIENVEPSDPASAALCFRYYKRVISHARNIVTSIIVPVDRLDYFDESKDTRDGDPPV